MTGQFRRGREGKFTGPAPSAVSSVLRHHSGSPVPCPGVDDGMEGLVLGGFPLHSHWAPNNQGVPCRAPKSAPNLQHPCLSPGGVSRVSSSHISPALCWGISCAGLCAGASSAPASPVSAELSCSKSRSFIPVWRCQCSLLGAD